MMLFEDDAVIRLLLPCGSVSLTVESLNAMFQDLFQREIRPDICHSKGEISDHVNHGVNF